MCVCGCVGVGVGCGCVCNAYPAVKSAEIKLHVVLQKILAYINHNIEMHVCCNELRDTDEDVLRETIALYTQ